MAVVTISQDPISGQMVYTALSTDALPNCAAGSIAYITDRSGRIDRYDGSAWAQTTTNGAAHVTISGGIDSRGNYPSTLYLEWVGNAGAADNAVIYSANVSSYNAHYIECTAGTVDVDVSLDGTNWIAAVVGRNIVTTGVFTQVNDAASGVCIEIRGKYKYIRVNQKGATASNARGSHGVI